MGTPLAVLLEFRLPNLTPKLEDVRINILELLCVTMQACDSTNVRCRLMALNSQKQSKSEATFTLKQLRMSVFIALSHVLVTEPYSKSKRCPAIYINGYGYAVETIKCGWKRLQQSVHAKSLVAQ